MSRFEQLMAKLLVPENSWIIFFLKDARFVSNDDTVAVNLFSHVRRVA